MLGDRLLVVDVQPLFRQSCNPVARRLVAALNETMPRRVVWYFVDCNGLDGDMLTDLMDYLLEMGLKEDLLGEIQFVGKDFGFLRSWMDSGADDETIITAVQVMLAHHVHDSRDLVEVVADSDEFDADFADEFLARANMYPLYLPTFAVGPLLSERTWTACGGGANECLREMELFGQANGVQFERLDQLVYC